MIQSISQASPYLYFRHHPPYQRSCLYFSVEVHWPQVLCIPDSRSHGVDLESPLALFARASRKGRSLQMHCRACFNLLLCPGWPKGYFMNYLMLICLMACHCSGPLLKYFFFPDLLTERADNRTVIWKMNFI